jgi:hypothetical protein
MGMGSVLLIANSVIAIIHNWHRHHQQFASMPEEGEALTFKNIYNLDEPDEEGGQWPCDFCFTFCPKVRLPFANLRQRELPVCPKVSSICAMNPRVVYSPNEWPGNEASG